MKRDLLIQMRNEWRDNVWLVVGLTVVSLAIWWFTMTLFFKVKGLFYEKGFDTEDVYKVDIRQLPADSPDYIERSEDEEESLDSQDLRMLIANIRKNPYVEVAAFSQNGLPYQYSYWGNALYLDMEPADTIGYSGNFRTVSPEMVRVLKVTSRTGKSEAELEKILREGGLLISNVFKSWNENFRKPEELNGKTVKMYEKSDQYKVGDIVNQIRRSDYDTSYGGMVLIPINEADNFYAEAIGIRMKPGMGEKFREAFENDAAMRVHGNYYLTKLTKMSEAAKSLQKKENTSARMGFALIVSLLLIIGLGMLGVFWFRMQQRVGEMAIRKVCGAKSTDIFRRVITEGIILLAVATLLAAVIGWPLLKTTFLKELVVDVPTVVSVEAATFVIVAAGITLSLWWPAKRAMAIEPAVAIKDE